MSFSSGSGSFLQLGHGGQPSEARQTSVMGWSILREKFLTDQEEMFATQLVIRNVWTDQQPSPQQKKKREMEMHTKKRGEKEGE